VLAVCTRHNDGAYDQTASGCAPSAPPSAEMIFEKKVLSLIGVARSDKAAGCFDHRLS